MGICFCRKKEDFYYSNDTLPDLDIDCNLDWSSLPNISPPNYVLTENQIAELYRKEYLFQNRYKI